MHPVSHPLVPAGCQGPVCCEVPRSTAQWDGGQLCQCPFASSTLVAETRWHCRSLNGSTDISLVILTETLSLSHCTYLLLTKELLMHVENGELAPGTGPYILFLSSLDLAQFCSTPESMNKSTYKRDCDSDIRHLTAFSTSFAPVTESSHPFQKKQSPVLLPVTAVECFAIQYITVFIHVHPSPWSDACLAVIFSR